MFFNTLKYNEKIAIAKLFFKEKVCKDMTPDFIPQMICINYNKFEFYTKAFGEIQFKIKEIEDFYNKNSKLIRKEKLLQIRKNLS
jgi:hypothetical protein